LNAAILQLLLGAVAIALAPIFAKLIVLTGSVSPIGAGFWRMAIGSLGFGVLILLRPDRKKSLAELRSLAKTSSLPISLAGILFACDLAAWHTSFEYTSVASSTLIGNTSAILVPLCGVLFFREVFKPNLAIGGVLAVAGVVGLVLLKTNAGRDASHDSLLLGEGLALITACLYTGYMLIIKRAVGSGTARTIMLISSAISALILCVLANSLDQAILPDAKIAWVWIFALGLICQMLGQGLVAKALTVLPVSQSALILVTAPASSAVFGWVILGETLSLSQIGCVGLSLLGITIVARR
jgi:drug/metabolite transporter (DMT)-like permease